MPPAARQVWACFHGARCPSLSADGPLFASVKPDDCLWNLVDGRQLEVTLAKRDGMQWWRCVVAGQPEIDTQKVEPEASKLTDLGEPGGLSACGRVAGEQGHLRVAEGRARVVQELDVDAPTRIGARCAPQRNATALAGNTPACHKGCPGHYVCCYVSLPLPCPVQSPRCERQSRR